MALRTLLLIVLTALAAPAFADESPPPITNDFALVVDASVPAPAASPALTALTAPAAPSAEAVLQDVNVLVTQSRNTTAWHLALAGLLAFVLKWLMDFLLHLTNPRDEVKRALPWVLGGVGIVVGVLDFYVRGASWVDAIIVGGGPPGATLVNELLNALRRKLEKPVVAALLVLLAFSTAGCGHGLATSARIVIGVDEVLIASETTFPEFDAAHQRALSSADLATYRSTQRPKVLASFEALSAAARAARQSIEAATKSKVDLRSVLRAVCTALAGVNDAGEAVKWPLPPAINIANDLCTTVK